MGKDRAMEWQELRAPGMPIGLFKDGIYEERVVRITSPSTLYLYTDGMYEIPLQNGDMWEHGGFRALLQEQSESDNAGLDDLVRKIHSKSLNERFPDDAAIIKVQFHNSGISDS
jgi:sigma-B regulation protein RsbU (phosphoserine phosphatase)